MKSLYFIFALLVTGLSAQAATLTYECEPQEGENNGSAVVKITNYRSGDATAKVKLRVNDVSVNICREFDVDGVDLLAGDDFDIAAPCGDAPNNFLSLSSRNGSISLTLPAEGHKVLKDVYQYSYQCSYNLN